MVDSQLRQRPQKGYRRYIDRLENGRLSFKNLIITDFLPPSEIFKQKFRYAIRLIGPLAYTKDFTF